MKSKPVLILLTSIFIVSCESYDYDSIITNKNSDRIRNKLMLDENISLQDTRLLSEWFSRNQGNLDNSVGKNIREVIEEQKQVQLLIDEMYIKLLE